MKLKVTETILKSSLLAWIIFLISCGGDTNNEIPETVIQTTAVLKKLN